MVVDKETSEKGDSWCTISVNDIKTSVTGTASRRRTI